MDTKESIFNWIENIITTCSNAFHLNGVDALIELFDKKFNDADLTFKLQEKRWEKWKSIHTIIT